MRRENDAYYTPDPLARAVVAELLAAEPTLQTAVAWEPHVGGGSFARALLAVGAVVVASDLDANAAGLRVPGLLAAVGGHDFLEDGALWRASWILGNPPFNQAESHVRRAIALSRRHVVFLLRLAFVESMQRVPFWQSHPARHIWMLAKRPSFTGGTTDSCAYGAFWWDNAHTGPTTCTPGWDWTGGE